MRRKNLMIRQSRQRARWRLWRIIRFFRRIEHHALSIFPRVDAENRADGYDNIGCHTAKTAVEKDQVVAQLQTHYCVRGDVQYDLAVGHIALRHIDPLVIHIDQQMRGAIIVHDPLIDSADNVGTARVQGSL